MLLQQAHSLLDLLLPLRCKTFAWGQKVGCKTNMKVIHNDTNCNFIHTCRRTDIIIQAVSLLPEEVMEVIRMSPKARVRVLCNQAVYL